MNASRSDNSWISSIGNSSTRKFSAILISLKLIAKRSLISFRSALKICGNSSSESDTFDFALSQLIIFVQEYSQAILVHRINLRKRKGTPYQTSPPLTQDIIGPFNMARLARAFSRRPVLLLRQHLGVSCPEVRVKQAHLVG